MKRRKFMAATAATSLAAPLTLAGSVAPMDPDVNEIYELRTYETSWGGNTAALMTFLNDVEQPYLKSHGSNHFMIFREWGQTQPSKIWVLVSYPDFSSYQVAVTNRTDANYLSKSSNYTSAGKTFNRISSSLLYAFDGLRNMKSPIENASLFELRIYEGVNEDAVRRKTKMFNQEEIDLFYRVDMNPIFFGNMLIGPYVPSLVYMLNFRDMEHRDKAWNDFREHPDWEVMRDKQEYAGTVSNIRRLFLELAV